MQSKIALILSALQAASAIAIPVTKRDVADEQTSLVSLDNEITVLAAEYITQDGPIAREVLVSAQQILSTLAPELLSPSDYTCPPYLTTPIIDNLSQAINTLNSTDLFVSQIVQQLDYSPSSAQQENITTNFCNVNNTISALQDYTYNNVGSDTTTVTPAIAETYTQIALKSLALSLSIIPATQPSTNYSQIAFNHTQDAITSFAKASGLTGPYSCPAEIIQPADSSESAMQYAVYLLEQSVPKAEEAVEENGGDGAISEFCEISDYMSAINEYVMA